MGIKVRKYSFLFLIIAIMALALIIPYTAISGAWFTFSWSGSAFFDGNYESSIVLTGSGEGATLTIDGIAVQNVTHAWDVSAQSADVQTLSTSTNPKAVLYLTSIDSGASYSAFLVGSGDTADYEYSEAPIYVEGLNSKVQSLSISNGITRIGNSLFRSMNNSNFTSVTIPNTVVSIGKDAFGSCSHLTSVVFEENSSLTTFGNSVFGYCNILSFTVPYSVTTFTDYLFIGNKNLTEIIFENQLDNNSYYMDGGCLIKRSTMSVVDSTIYPIIPQGVVSIGTNAFRNKDITITSIPNSVERIYGGVFGAINNTQIVIPSSVDYLGSQVFTGASNLTAIYMEHTSESEITTLNANWLTNCNATVYWYSETENFDGAHWYYDNGVPTVWRIPEYSLGTNADGLPILLDAGNEVATAAYYDVSSAQNGSLIAFIIEKATDNHEFVMVGSGAMYVYKADTIPYLTYMPTIKKATLLGVTDVTNFLFQNATSLTKVSLPDTLITMRWNLFDGCSSLDNVVIPKNVKQMSPCGFRNCTSLTNITFEATNVTSFGYSMFYGCTSLKSVDLPYGFTTLDGTTFYNCTALEEVTVPDSVTTFGTQVFWECTSLKSFTMPNSVTTIGNYAFYHCSALETITLSNQLTNIPSACFDGCLKLGNFTIPSTVKSIGDVAIRQCNEMTELIVPDGVESIGKNGIYNNAKLVNLVIPNSVTTIGVGTFAWNTVLETITLSTNITSIPNGMFEGCYKLKGVTIPSGVTTIGEKAFNACQELQYINFETTSVTEIPYQAIYNCTSLTELVIPEGVTTLGESAISRCTSLQKITLPSTLQTIGHASLYGLSSLEEIVIPQSVTSIGQTALSTCNKLSKIYFEHTDTSNVTFGENWMVHAPATLYYYSETPNYDGAHWRYVSGEPRAWEVPAYSLSFDSSGNPVLSLGNEVVEGATYTEISEGVYSFSQEVDGEKELLTIIGSGDMADNMFLNSETINEVVVSQGITKIGNYAFTYAPSLENVEIHTGTITTIGDFAFGDCHNLEQVTIGEGVLTIGEYAFNYCQQLTTVNLGGTTSILANAFCDCTGLTSIIIPECMTSIDAQAFNGCTNLTTIYVEHADSTILGTDWVPEGANVYYYSETEQVGYWHYDTDGTTPVLW